MNWKIMIITNLGPRAAFMGKLGPLANNDADVMWFKTYNEAVDASKNLVHMLDPLDIVQVRFISDAFSGETVPSDRPVRDIRDFIREAEEANDTES